jgi:hypothetical protein
MAGEAKKHACRDQPGGAGADEDVMGGNVQVPPVRPMLGFLRHTSKEIGMRTKLVLLLALVIQAGCQSLPQKPHDPYYTAPVGMRGSNH